jgi:prepilin-type N-terminal cleavage/methylation domain-containing protein
MKLPFRIPKKLRSARGFSLIEMMAVFTVLAVAILPLASIQIRARQEISESMREGQATQLAHDLIENARASGFATAQADSSVSGVFTYSVNIVPDAVNPFLQEIQVNVIWQYEGETQQLTMASKQASR